MPEFEPREAPPAGLRETGRALWVRVHEDLPEEGDLDARERKLLEDACKLADTAESLERAIARDGLTVRGAAGQRRLNAAVPELRQTRLAVSKLLSELKLPNAAELGRVESSASRRGRHAARARWDGRLRRVQ